MKTSNIEYYDIQYAAERTIKHILRHFYYTTMQKLCEFEALYRLEIQCKCHKGSPQKEQFLKTLVSQEVFRT